MSVQEVVIVSAVRTAIGRFGGTLRSVPAHDMAAAVLRAAVDRAKIDPARVDEVVMGHSYVSGESPNVARQAVLLCDFPVEVPAHGVERQCGSGLQAICDATMQIQTGNAQIVVAGGVESMSNLEYYVTGARWGMRMGDQVFHDRWDATSENINTHALGRVPNMLHTAANVAAKLGITREEQDAFAFRSQRNCAAAIAAGKFKDEIIPLTVQGKKGPTVFDSDEHPRPETTLESLSGLRPVCGDTVTAGNSSGMNDGAAACVLMAEETALAQGLEPLGYVRAWAVAGVHPAYMGLGPVNAVRKVLAKAGLTLADIDVIELNEAFAAQALGVIKELGITDLSNLNVNGSGIALGHPISCTGARIMATLLNEMKRRGARYGLETLCSGGGQGIAAIIERK